MIIDKEEHKVILLQIIDITNFPGKTLEAAMELKNAVKNATVEKDKKG